VTEAWTLIAIHLNSIDDSPMAHHLTVPAVLRRTSAILQPRESLTVGLSMPTAIWCLMLTLVVGCQTTGGDKFTYRTMPQEMLAARRDNVQTLDLTRMA